MHRFFDPPSESPSHDATDLTLYTSRFCGYCERVRRALRDLNVRIEERDARRDAQAGDALRRATGRHTVPVLRIAHADGRVEWMPESRDIVRYLYDRFASSSPAR